MSWFFLALAAIAAAYAVREIAATRIAALPLFLLALMLATSSLAPSGIIYSDFARIWSRMGAVTFALENCLYTSCILLGYWVVYWLASQGPAATNTMQALSPKSGNFQNFLAFTILIYSAYHMSLTNWSAFWSNYQYLSIGAVTINSNPVTGFVLRFAKVVSLLAFALLGTSIIANRKLPAAMLALACSWFMILAIASHSRISVVFAGVLALVLFLSKKRSHKSLSIVVVLFAVANLANSLLGRSGEQGLSSLSSYFDYSLELKLDDIGGLFTNIFEGAFVQGEVFYFTNTEHYENYKLLSLSPLPSFIDGFDSILGQEIRFSVYVPMGATGEVFLFGPGYMVTYFSVVLFCYYVVAREFYRRPGYFSLAMLCIFILASHIQFAYQARGVFRLFILPALAICLWRCLPRKPNKPPFPSQLTSQQAT